WAFCSLYIRESRTIKAEGSKFAAQALDFADGERPYGAANMRSRKLSHQPATELHALVRFATRLAEAINQPCQWGNHSLCLPRARQISLQRRMPQLHHQFRDQTGKAYQPSLGPF